MSTIRKTSVYTLLVPNLQPGELDLMAKASTELGAQVSGLGTLDGQSLLRFRIAGGDTAAIDHAASLIGTRTGCTLVTGVGVNRRTVATS